MISPIDGSSSTAIPARNAATGAQARAATAAPSPSIGDAALISIETLAKAVDQLLQAQGLAVYRAGMAGLSEGLPDLATLLAQPDLSIAQRQALLSQHGGEAATGTALEDLGKGSAPGQALSQSVFLLLFDRLARENFTLTHNQASSLMEQIKLDALKLPQAQNDPNGLAGLLMQVRTRFVAIQRVIDEARAGDAAAYRWLQQLASLPGAWETFLAYAASLNGAPIATPPKVTYRFGKFLLPIALILGYLLLKYLF